jgi:hypothetical protein
MRHLSVIILVFSILFAAFVMGPPFLGYKFGPYPLMYVADVVDLLTPLVLIPFYWLLFRVDRKVFTSWRENVVFMVFVAIWVLGQGMHLAANSIGHQLQGMVGQASSLANFYDEVLSHYTWHLGVAGLSAILIYRQHRNPFAKSHPLHWAIAVGGVLYGFTYFAMVIEGGTAPLGISFNVIILLAMLIYCRRRLAQQPLVLFFLVAYLLSAVLFAGWGIYWKGLPEFSEVGIF